MNRDMPHAQTVRRFTVAVLLLLAASRGVVALARPSPIPPSATSNACATAVPNVPNNLPTAFAYELDSPGVLGLISSIKALPTRERTRVFDAVTNAAASPAERRLEGIESSSCPTLDDIYGTSRVLYLCVNEWKLREFANAARRPCAARRSAFGARTVFGICFNVRRRFAIALTAADGFRRLHPS